MSGKQISAQQPLPHSYTQAWWAVQPRFIWPLLVLFSFLLSHFSAASADAILEGRTLRYERNDQILWQKRIPAGLGALIGPVSLDNAVYLGIGPTVYAWNNQGELLGRADLPALVSLLDASGGVVRVGVEDEGYNERFTLGDPKDLSLPVAERVVFLPKKEVTHWLMQAAYSLPEEELAQAAKDDPSNPFYVLRQAELAQKRGVADDYERLSALRRSMSAPLPFFAQTQLAVKLDALGLPSAADLALSRARKDAALHGLDPEIPINRAALAAYGDPIGYVGTLLEQGRSLRAEVWMQHLRELHPRAERSTSLYLRYAEQLEAQGRTGEAEEWRQFTRSLRTGTLYNLGSNDTALLRQSAQWLAAALSLALAAALMTLVLRSLRTEREETRALGGYWLSWRSPLRRLRYTALAYARLSERSMLFTLSLLLLLALLGWKWAVQTQQALSIQALNVGTYGGVWQMASLDDLNLRPVPETQFLRGIAAQLAEDDAVARSAYAKLNHACALNNLGVLAQRSDDVAQAREYYRAALALRPEQSATLYNLGLRTTDPVIAFQQKYRAGEPRLCYPDRRMLAQAVSEDVASLLRRAVFQPYSFVQAGFSRLNVALLACWLLCALFLLMLALPRTPLPVATERRLTLGALLFPGTGLLSNPWGGMLLLIWALSSMALLPIFGLRPAGGPVTGQLAGAVTLAVWGGSYVLNLLVMLWLALNAPKKEV